MMSFRQLVVAIQDEVPMDFEATPKTDWRRKKRDLRKLGVVRKPIRRRGVVGNGKV